MSRRVPRPIGELLLPATARLAPATTLAAVQRCWDEVVGPRIAGCARPTGERDGVLQIGCEDAVWASELELMGPTLVDSLNAAIGRPALRLVRVRAGASKASRKPL